MSRSARHEVSQSEGLRFARELLKLDLRETPALLHDPVLDGLKWAVRWTWLAVLSLAARHQHGLTFASRRSIGLVRERFRPHGSSEAAVKRHLQDLQRKGLLLRFKELRQGHEAAIKHLYVTVVLFPTQGGLRAGLSPEARELVHGWGARLWSIQPHEYFLGPRVNQTRDSRVIRRRVYFRDLVALNAEAADVAAARQGRPLSVGHSLSEVTRRRKDPSPNPGPQPQNRASAEMSQAPESRGAFEDAGELADPARLVEATIPVQGLHAHRRPQGGTPAHPRPQGGIRASQAMGMRSDS